MATVRHRKPENWMEAIRRNRHGLQSEDALTPSDRAIEALLMGLRLKEGVDLDRIDPAVINPEAVTNLTRQGLLHHNASRIAVTPEGMLLTEAILREIVA
jgi:coproporphyrinogen III oxidase-like Fe-S oxidoreductase